MGQLGGFGLGWMSAFDSSLLFIKVVITTLTSLVAQTVKHLPTMRETQVQSLGREDLLEKEMKTHSCILVWKILWTKEHGRLQFMGSQRVRHDWAHSVCRYRYRYVDIGISSIEFSHSVMSDSLWPHGLQYARLPYPSPTPGACSNSCPLSWWDNSYQVG